MKIKLTIKELKEHIPFTALGSFLGIIAIFIFLQFNFLHENSEKYFWSLHALHIVFSAIATTSIYRIYRKSSFWTTLIICYIGSVGLGTISDSLIPYLGEWILGMPHRHTHVGFWEMWWLINPLAIISIIFAYFRPIKKLPHAGHVLISTFASSFHILMADGQKISPITLGLIAIFLFFAVWVPCCLSDIIFPTLFSKK